MHPNSQPREQAKLNSQFSDFMSNEKEYLRPNLKLKLVCENKQSHSKCFVQTYRNEWAKWPSRYFKSNLIGYYSIEDINTILDLIGFLQ